MKCSNCEKHQKEIEKYKRKYETAKSGLTQEERSILVELICNEQLKHMIVNNKYESERYNLLEQLKVRIKDI